MFGELAVIITVTLLGSLFTAATFSPMLASQWMNNSHTLQQKEGLLNKFYGISERMFKSWENSYSHALGWSLRHKKLVLIGFSSVFVFSLVLSPFIGNEFVPEEDTGDVRLTINLSLGTRLEESDKVANRIEGILEKEVPEAKFIFVRTGETSGRAKAMGQTSGTHIITGGVKLVPKTERKRSMNDIAQALRDRIKQIPGILKIDVSMGNPVGKMITGTGGKKIRVEIIGHDFAATDVVAEKIKTIMEDTEGAVDVSISRELLMPQLNIHLDREKASSLGLNMKTIADSLYTYIQGDAATKYREKGETYDISVRLEEDSRKKIEDIENLTIVAPSNQKQIRLSNVSKIKEVFGPVFIERQNRERVVRVECNTFRRSSGKVIEDIKRRLKGIVLPADVVINFGGEAEEQAKAFKDLTLLLILGILLVYMIMAAQFESLLDPFIIMFSIPFTFIGVIWALLLTRMTLNMISFLGVIMLMGIVVNNAIVLISYIIILRARGFSMYEAVTEAGRDRLRPVLMTTITTLAGLLPLAISRGIGSETWQPLGITMLGGLTVSTLITLIFVPTLYAVFHRKSAFLGGKK